MRDNIPTSEELNKIIEDGFLDFCKSKDPEEVYHYCIPGRCALAQFLSTEFTRFNMVSPSSVYFFIFAEQNNEEIPYDVKYDVAVLDEREDGISDYTFDGLAKRLEELRNVSCW